MTIKVKSLKPGVYGVRQGDGSEEDEVTIVEEEQVEEEQIDDEQDDETIDVDDDEAEAEEETSEEPDESEEQQVDDDDGEVIVTIGDEEPQEEEDDEKAPNWVRELRKSHRETARENRELKEKLKAMEASSEPQAVQLGKKPTLEDFDYDTDKYEQELTAWYDRKRQVDEQAAEAKAQEKAATEAWQQKLQSYGEAKGKLKVKDFDDAEEVVLNSMDQTQQGIIIQGADNPALVIYALGKNGNRAKELSSIKDPVKFAFAVAKLEKDLKVRNRKAPPPPEKKVSGTAPKSGSVDSTLERLRAEAERTGNYSKVHKYKQQQRAKAKK